MPLNSTRGAASSKGFGFGSADLLGPGLLTVATGGTITTSGDYKIHTFTGPGAFTVTSVGKGPTNPLGGPNTVSYLVLAGGGNGAGGYREGRDIAPSYTASPLVAPTGLTLTRKENFPITVGAGGNATSSKGSNSVFSTITAAGGGSNFGPAACSTNRSGGSGSGGNGSPQPVLAGNTPPVSPPQGNPGGTNRCGQSNSGVAEQELKGVVKVDIQAGLFQGLVNNQGVEAEQVLQLQLQQVLYLMLVEVEEVQTQHLVLLEEQLVLVEQVDEHPVQVFQQEIMELLIEVVVVGLEEVLVVVE
jgi:hypothetical protein